MESVYRFNLNLLFILNPLSKHISFRVIIPIVRFIGAISNKVYRIGVNYY